MNRLLWDAMSWDERWHSEHAHAVYLHIPFCARKCRYCDFPSWATRMDDPIVSAYTTSLASQLAQLSSAGMFEAPTTCYVGGGTPSLLADNLAEFVGIAGYLIEPEELTVEANPETLTDTMISDLADAGVSRISMGVQSTNDDELRVLGRIHTAARALERVRAVAESGIHASCDLMCALPLQTEASFTRSVLDVLDAGAGHVSVYPLQVEEGTPIWEECEAGRLAWPEQDVEAMHMQLAARLLEAHGLSRYEVASYALPGHASVHNQAYWMGVTYLGLGTGASSMLAREGYERLRVVCPQLPSVADDIARVRLQVTSSRQEVAATDDLSQLHFSLELLTDTQAAAEDLMLGARLSRGIESALVEEAEELLGSDQVEGLIEDALYAGLVVLDEEGNVVPTEQGWLRGNELYGELWALAPGEVESLEV